MRLCLVNDSSHNPNWGCRATSAALRTGLLDAGHEIVSTIYLEELQGVTVEDRPSWRRIARFLDTYGPRRPIVRSLASSAFDKVRSHLPDVVPRSAAELDAGTDAVQRGVALDTMLERMSAVEGVLINGEGGIYGGQRKGRLMLLLAHLAASRLGLWAGIVNHTADLADPGMASLARRVYPTLDLLTFRDQLSLEACAPFAPAGRFVPDAAFVNHPAARGDWLYVVDRPGYFDVWPERARFDPARPYVAVGGSAVLVASTASSQAGTGFASLVRALRAAGMQVVLTASDVPDARLFRRLAEELEAPLIGMTTPVPQAIDLIAGAAAYVGGRWHPAIFGLLGGTPFVPLSTNSHKLTALAQRFGLGAPAADALQLESAVDEVVELTMNLVREGTRLRSRLAAAASREREAALSLPWLIPGALPPLQVAGSVADPLAALAPERTAP